MKRTINEYDFVNAFDEMGMGDNFSYAGRKVLFDIMTEYEDACGEELELDVIAICCRFKEYTIYDLSVDYDCVKDEIARIYNPCVSKKCNAVEFSLDRIGAIYRWIDDETLILDVESFYPCSADPGGISGQGGVTMYDIYLYGNLTESHPDYFQAKCRADYLYMQGHIVEIRQGEKILIKYIHFGGVK